jgi:AraC-like DNA-binding protein
MAAPHPALRGHVLRYCGYTEPEPVARREVATPAVTVIFSFGSALEVDGERFGSFVAGVDAGFSDTRHDGAQEGLEVKLAPWAVLPLLGVPAGELTGRVVALDDVLGETLTARLADAPGWGERFALLDAALAARLERASAVPADVLVAWRRLATTHGAVPIATLAGELGWSRRHFGERFRAHVGMAPKPAARILRFRRALALLERDDGARMGDIALDCGYYDQAHLNRDFRAFAGSAPGDHLRRRLPA